MWLLNILNRQLKQFTEEIIVKQGGKTWLTNLGKFVPFIGVGICAIMNSYSPIKTAINIVSYFHNTFDERKVDFIKNLVESYSNISEQVKALIEKISAES